MTILRYLDGYVRALSTTSVRLRAEDDPRSMVVFDGPISREAFRALYALHVATVASERVTVGIDERECAVMAVASPDATERPAGAGRSEA